MRNVLQVKGLPGYPSGIGRWLWAMEEVRHRTIGLVGDLDQATLDWRGPGGDENAIGSLLYHIALVEMSWLFLDILERDFPVQVQVDFPFPMTDTDGRLNQIPAVPVGEHLSRMERSREVFRNAAREVLPDEWGRLRSPADVDYEVTPEWALFHLVEHEAGHAFQISSLRSRALRHVVGP